MGSIANKVLVAVLTAVVLGALTLMWNWISDGGVIRALGGVTKNDLIVTLQGNLYCQVTDGMDLAAET